MKKAWILGLCVLAVAAANAGNAKKGGAGKADAGEPAVLPAPTEFARFDLDADGFLTEAEFIGGGNTNVAALPPVKQQERRKEFQKIDEDRDRKVSAAEYDAAHAPKVKSDPKAAQKKDGGKGNTKSLRRKAEQITKRMKLPGAGGK